MRIYKRIKKEVLGIDSDSLEIIYNEVKNDTEKGKKFLKALGWV